MLFRKHAQGVVQLIARLAVALGRHDQKSPPARRQEVDELPVAFLWGDVRIHQCQAKRECRPFFEVRINEVWPLRRNFARDLGIAVAWQIGENQLRTRLSAKRSSKKLMARVRPGVELVRASFAPTSALITLDLPTFDRPRKAISGSPGEGKCPGSEADNRNCERTRTLQCEFSSRNLQVAEGNQGKSFTTETRRHREIW